MKTRLSLCLQYWEEVESKTHDLQRNPTADPSADDAAVMIEALAFVQHAIAAVRRT